jgi:aspartate oxidase
MFDSVDHATLHQYSPRGTSEMCKTSRKVTDTIKAGLIENYRNRISKIVAENQEQLSAFLNDGVTLVPAQEAL